MITTSNSRCTQFWESYSDGLVIGGTEQSLSTWCLQNCQCIHCPCVTCNNTTQPPNMTRALNRVLSVATCQCPFLLQSPGIPHLHVDIQQHVYNGHINSVYTQPSWLYIMFQLILTTYREKTLNGLRTSHHLHKNYGKGFEQQV